MTTIDRATPAPFPAAEPLQPHEPDHLLARARRRLVLAVVFVGMTVPTALILARYPRWWTWIASEDTPMTWLQSCTLVLTSAGAALVGFVGRLRQVSVAERRAWWILAFGFGGLAFDERFALHERVRDSLLAPRGVSIPLLPWIGPGDFLVMGIAVCGLLVLPRVWRALASDGGARRALTVGVALALVAVGLDSIDPSRWSVDAERFEQTLEEIVELASGLSFLAAIALALLTALARLGERARSFDAAGTPGDLEHRGGR